MSQEEVITKGDSLFISASMSLWSIEMNEMPTRSGGLAQRRGETVLDVREIPSLDSMK